jgi:peptidoglycan/LPS O-acetylase OafA/YrhL
MSNNKPTKYVYELDYLRGIAALSVVAYHLTSYGPYKKWMVDSPITAIESVTHYGLFGVHFFFMISGFVILMSAQKASLKQFAVSRAARLYPAFWAGCVITTAVAYTLGSAFPLPSLPSFLANITIVPEWFGANMIDGAYWSLLVEVHFYIFIAAIIALGLMAKIETVLYGWICLAVADLFISIWKLQFLFNIRWASLFAAGALAWIILDQGGSKKRWAAFCICGLLSVLKFGTYIGLSLNWADYKADPISIAIIVSCFACFALVATEKLKLPQSKLGFYMGALTYPVYVVHQNFGYSIYNVLRSDAYGLSKASALLIVLSSVLFTAFLVFKLIEKPLGSFIKRVAK